MSGLVFIFPGQGSQKVGMGADFCTEDPPLYERYMQMAHSATWRDRIVFVGLLGAGGFADDYWTSVSNQGRPAPCLPSAVKGL